MATKIFVNNTDTDINITLLIRQEKNIAAPSLKQVFDLKAGESKLVRFGDEMNQYLNGLILQWKDQVTQSLKTISQEILDTGVSPSYDWTLNTNGKICIDTIETMNISVSP